MRVWGITGTNGKTTTTWILSQFLSAAPNRKCGYITTVEVNTLSRQFYTGYTTPPLDRLHEIYAEMNAAGATDCVMEVSSHAIHQNRTGDTVFAGGAFTNLSEDHLDYHKTMEEYFRVKLSFAEKIAAQHKDDPEVPPYVVCMDGGYAEEMLAAVSKLRVKAIPVSFRDTTYDLSRLQLVGDYNKSNILVAAALAEAAGVEREIVQTQIPLLVPRWGRLERVESASAAKVYVDFAHTPDGLAKVLVAARGFTRGRLWVVFGAGGDRDPMKRAPMGEACALGADELVVTSDNPRSEEPLAIIKAIVQGAQAAKPNVSLAIEPDRMAAIHLALKNAKAGDTVLICGKGHETTQEIKGVKMPFDDREVVRKMRLD